MNHTHSTQTNLTLWTRKNASNNSYKKSYSSNIKEEKDSINNHSGCAEILIRSEGMKHIKFHYYCGAVTENVCKISCDNVDKFSPLFFAFLLSCCCL